MVLKNNTILITGGSSGVGLEMARELSNDNVMLICGRTREKLAQAKSLIPNIKTFQCDISDRSQCEDLCLRIQKHYPECNILVNNAAIVHRTDFYKDDEIIEKADKELGTNFMGPLMLTKLLLPMIANHSNSAIININTGLVYAPRAQYPIYNATKSALHAFTQVLRIQLKETPVSIVEVLLPVVDTPWHNGNVPDIAISAHEAVDEMLTGIKKGKTEVKVGKVKFLGILSRISPSLALKRINSI